jgi:hypothetical protein
MLYGFFIRGPIERAGSGQGPFSRPAIESFKQFLRTDVSRMLGLAERTGC